MDLRPMPTRTRVAAFVVALAATAVGFVTPAGALAPDSAADPRPSVVVGSP